MASFNRSPKVSLRFSGGLIADEMARIVKLCIFVVCLITQTGREAAEKIPKAIADYLKPFLAEEISKEGNSAEWDETGYGGYLIRRYTDITGDGIPDMFLTTSLASFKYEAEWRVFKVGDNGELSAFAGSIPPYSKQGEWTEVSDTGNVVWVYEGLVDYESDEGIKNRFLPLEEVKHSLMRMEFEYPNIHLFYESVTDAEVEKLRPRSPLISRGPLEAVLLADYLSDPSTPWVEVGWDINTSDFFAIREDAERIEKNSAFSPSKALALLEKDAARGGRNDRGKTSDLSGVSTNQSSLRNEERDLQDQRKLFGWPWLVGGGIVTFSALAYVLNRLKNDSI